MVPFSRELKAVPCNKRTAAAAAAAAGAVRGKIVQWERSEAERHVCCWAELAPRPQTAFPQGVKNSKTNNKPELQPEVAPLGWGGELSRTSRSRTSSSEQQQQRQRHLMRPGDYERKVSGRLAGEPASQPASRRFGVGCDAAAERSKWNWPQEIKLQPKILQRGGDDGRATHEMRTIGLGMGYRWS